VQIKFLIFVLGLLPLFAGCIGDLILQSNQSETVQPLRWSPDGSTIYALRAKPFDSAGVTEWNNFIEQYNYQGDLLSSVQINSFSGFYGFTADCQHLIITNRSGVCIAMGDSVTTVVQDNASIESESPSGNILATDSNIIGAGSEVGIDGWWQLSWVGNGNSRIIQHWKAHVQMFPSLAILSDKCFSFEEYLSGSNQFSIYDTNLNLLYRKIDPAGNARGISYVPSINAVVAELFTTDPNKNVVLIDLKSDSVKTVFNQEIIGTAPDGFHVVYISNYNTLTIRNLLTNAEKDVASDNPLGVVFSPDASYLAYSIGVPPQIKSIAVGALP
jgi:hypothetical protein